MELVNMTTVTVFTLDRSITPIKVSCPIKDDTMPAEIIHKSVCSSLGFKEKSRNCFALFDGSQKPCQKYTMTDEIPAKNKELCLRKWCFSESLEKDIMKKDDLAVHLLFLEAKEQVEDGNVICSKEEELQLEELSEPGFILEKKYVQLCHTLNGYWSVRADNCVVLGDSLIEGIQLMTDCKICLKLDRPGIALTAAGNQSCHISWYQVQMWHHYPTTRTIQFDIKTGNQTCLVPLRLQTEQAHYLFCCIKEIITVLQGTGASSPKFFIDMIKTTEDGGNIIENALFDPGKVEFQK